MNKNSIIERLENQKGHVGFYFENLVTGEKIEYKQNEPFLAASVIKLPIFMCIAKWVKEGKASFTDTVRVREEDKLPICGALTLMSGEFDVDVISLCRLMISISDNAATNLLIKKFGIEAYRDEFLKIGLTGTKLNRLLFDAEAGARGLENYIVPEEIAALLKQVYSKNFVDEDTSDLILQTLLLQQINHKIPGIIGEDTVPIAHKTGEDENLTNDVGIVFAKQPFVLCFTGHDTDVAAFEYLIRTVSYEVFEEYNR